MQRRLSALDKGGEWNRLDAMETAFHQRVREGYHALISEEPQRWVTINAAQPVEKVQADIQAAISKRLNRDKNQ